MKLFKMKVGDKFFQDGEIYEITYLHVKTDDEIIVSYKSKRGSKTVNTSKSNKFIFVVPSF